ncbi:MAG: hypothetical protein JNM66_31230 [Bryobacterales bacterium]|nr:hypothetical protein [Bryobacterales bacterium]
MAKKENPVAVAPGLFTVRVLLAGSNDPVKGLFIAFKLSPPAGEKEDTKAAKVARVVETPHVKEFNEKRYKRLQKQYEAQLAETVPDPADQFVLGITDVDGYLEPVYATSNPWRDRHARLEPDSFKFSAGEEYFALYIRHPSPDLARALTRGLNNQFPGRAEVDFHNTDLWGAMPGTSGFAKYFGFGGPAVQRFRVENGSGKDGEQFVIHVPPKAEAYVPQWQGEDKSYRWWLYAGMPHENLSAVRQQVEEAVDSLGKLKYPATGDQDTPYSVPGLKAAITRTEKSKSMGESAKAKRVKALTDAYSFFHGPLQAAAARFQEHLGKGEAMRLEAWDPAHEEDSWASEIGAAAAAKASPVPAMEQGGVIGPRTHAAMALWIKNRWVKPPQHLVTIGNGVLMLARGAFAFNAWSELAKVMGCRYGMKSGHSYRQLLAEGGGGAIKNSIHKTGLASDMTGGRQRTSTEDWPIRFEAEFRRLKASATVAELERALEQKQQALDALTAEREKDRAKAQETLDAANAAKETMEAPDNPKPPTKKQTDAAKFRVKSAEKALGGIDKKYETRVAKATRERDAAAKAIEDAKRAIHTDGYRLPDRWRMRFRLYGHSSVAVFKEDGTIDNDEVERLKTKIAEWAGLPANPDEKDDGGVGGGFARFVRANYLKGVDEKLANDWIRTQFKEAYGFAKDLAALEAAELVNRYYRATVTQWRVNFYELDGGTDSLTVYKPDEGDADFPAREWARSWLNLSAVGHGCQMHRIQPHKWETRDRASFSADPSKVPPTSFPMENYLQFETSKAEQGDLVAAIEDITASQQQAPELAHKKYVIEFREAGAKGKETTVDETALPDEVDTPFFKEWRRKINPLKKIPKVPAYLPGSKGVYLPGGAQISVVLNELNPDRQDGLKQVLKLFRNDFQDKSFQVAASGVQVDDELPAATVLTGAELAAAADKALARLTAEATAAKQKADDEAAAAKLAAEVAGKGAKKKQVRKADLPKPAKIKVEDWSFLVQPVFSKPAKQEPGKPPAPRKMLFLPEHIVMLPPRENAAHLEWWHFQHHSVKAATNWAQLLNECGYSTPVMSTPLEGATQATGEPVHFGLGYSIGFKGSELDSTPWPSPSEIAERPSNSDSISDEAVEEEEAYIE